MKNQSFCQNQINSSLKKFFAEILYVHICVQCPHLYESLANVFALWHQTFQFKFGGGLCMILWYYLIFTFSQLLPIISYLNYSNSASLKLRGLAYLSKYSWYSLKKIKITVLDMAGNQREKATNVHFLISAFCFLLQLVHCQNFILAIH